MLNRLSSCFFFVLLFALSCQPVELDYHSVQVSSDADFTSDVGFVSRKDTLLRRSSQPRFQEYFVSHKLDMVFVLDTHEDMKSFYEKDFLGPDFLKNFDQYDWRLAWTDMSINLPALKDKNNQESSSEDSNCSFLPSLVMSAGGILANAPRVAEFGLRGLVDCLSGININIWEKEETQYANGLFLPFEASGQQAVYQLTNQVSDKSDILRDSLLLPNPKDKKYKAPILKQNQSFPLLSVFFSLAENLYNRSRFNFFRKDSLIVFVIVSFKDTKLIVSPSVFKDSLTEALGSHQRFKLVLITLTKDSNILCPISYSNKAKAPEKLTKLVKGLNQPVLDICSQDLGERLFNEISKNLSVSLL